MSWLVLAPLVGSVLFVLIQWLGARIGGPSKTPQPTPAETTIVDEGAKTVAEAQTETKTNIEEIRNDSNAGLGNRLRVLRERGRVRK